MTFPKGEGQIPIYYNHKNTGRPADIKSWTQIDKIPVEAVQHSLGNTSHYLDYGFEPLFPFGYGLSYSTFAYANLKVSKKEIPMDGFVEVSSEITNTGKYEANEVVQLYIHDRFGSITRPVKELKGFKRISLKPGETKNVSFKLTTNDLAFWNNESIFQAEPGDFDVWVGPSSAEGLKGSFAIK
jgi:beta-glucosidase